MKALFIHGMGRTSLSALPLLRELQKRGIETCVFNYFTTLESFDHITERLSERIGSIASSDEYIIIGHSLGGVLARRVLGDLDEKIRKPKALFLLGSPIRFSPVARALGRNPLFMFLAGDCGQILGSAERMAEIKAPVGIPVFGIAGVVSETEKHGPLRGQPNDGLVTVREISAPWLTGQFLLPVPHTLLPCSRMVARVIMRFTGFQ